MSSVVKCRFCEPNIDNLHTLKDYLPEDYEYMVCSLSIRGAHFKAKLRMNGKGQDFAQKWLEDFQMHTKCTMRVERTYPHSGTKNVFKIDLRCQHNTRPRTEKVKKESCKNTDCPAKMGITIKRVVTERKSRSKDPHLPDYPAVIQIDFCHNHAILAPEILKHRSVLPEVREKILNLFKLGHNPSTALDMHKYDLQLEYGENYNEVSQDRALLPDHQFCYRLYYKIIRKHASANGEVLNPDVTPVSNPDIDKEYSLQNLDTVGTGSSLDDPNGGDSASESSSKKVKKKRKLESTVVDKTEMANQLEDALCKFCESGGFAGMQLIDDNTVMALCTPLMHRVHTFVKQSGEFVFIDSYGELDEPNSCRIMMFVTNSSAGALPLGCIVTTATTSTCIKAALDLWKQILPEGCFYGKSEGPQIFLTNDNEDERQSLKASFPQSHLLLCISHILQKTWNCLWDKRNGIKKDHRSLLFGKIKMLLFSQTAEELEMHYAYIMQDTLVKTYSVFIDHLNTIYNLRHDWALAYRRHLLPRTNDPTIFWEISMILLKDPILSRTRTYNQLQIIDFLSRLDTYYERCLIDMANYRFDSVKYSRFLFIDMPREAYTITQKSETEYEVHNDTKDTTYQTEITLGMCECRTGKSGAPCKHQLLIFRNFTVHTYECTQMYSPSEKAFLFQLATGQEVENMSIIEDTSNVQNMLNDSCSPEMMMHDLSSCSNGDFFLGDGGPCESLSEHSTIANNSVVNRHNSTLGQHNSGLAQHNGPLNHQHATPLNQHNSSLNQHQSTLGQHASTLGHHGSILSHALTHHQSSHINQHIPSLNHHSVSLSQQPQPVHQHAPPPPVAQHGPPPPNSQHAPPPPPQPVSQHVPPPPPVSQHGSLPPVTQHSSLPPPPATQHAPPVPPPPVTQHAPLPTLVSQLTTMPLPVTQHTSLPPPPVSQHAALPLPPVSQHASLPPTAIPQHGPPSLPPQTTVSSAQPQIQTVHNLIDEACQKLKDRSSRIPQTFIPALNTFLKNFDKLSSDSSLEYALYTFGKFSKSAMPLFKRKIVNNKLVGLQSTGDFKRKRPPHLRTSKVLRSISKE